MDKKISAAQEAAIRHRDGPAMVTAGPGSGKTLVIAERIRYLVDSFGVDPSLILTITFTNAAAEEMKRRAVKIMPTRAAYLTFGTFHSIFFLILKHTFNLNSGNILSNSQRYMILNDILKVRGTETGDRKQLISDLISLISNYKNTGRINSSLELADGELEEIIEMYRIRLEGMNLLDFDDMLLKCRKLFYERKDVLKIWQKRYRYIQVDEFQDINEVQYEVVRLLAGRERNLFVVGDDDQAIYGFRGSKPGIMKRFKEDHPDLSGYELSVNYRSDANIVGAASKVISFNKERLEKDIRAYKEATERIRVIKARDITGEIDAISDLLKNDPDKDACDKTAILLRTNTMTGLYAQGLRASGLFCRTGLRTYNIYKSGPGKDILDYMRFAAGDDSREVFLNIFNKPDRGIYRGALTEERVDINALLAYYRDDLAVRERIEKLFADRRMLFKLKPSLAIHYLCHAMGYMDYLKKKAGRGDVFASYKNTADEIEAKAGRYRSINEWLKYAKDGDMGTEGDKGVNVLTMHASKGLEFDTVIIPDLNEGMIPYGRAVMPEQTEEERRLFYVALTRAKKKLILLYSDENSGKKRYPSRFLEETGLKEDQSSISPISSLNS